MDLSSDSDLETDSMIALDLDPDDDSDISLSDTQTNTCTHEDQLSTTSSVNAIDDLLQDLDTSSDEIDDQSSNLETTNLYDNLPFVHDDQNHSDNEDENFELSVDLDRLSEDDRNSDEMFDVLNRDPEWTQNYTDIHVKQFTGEKGYKLPPHFDVSTASPLDYFQLFFSDNVFETIVKNTNSFKRFRCQQKRITQPAFEEKFWEDTNVNEMEAFFGIAIMFGILNQPRYRTFWSKDPFLGNPGVQRVFSLKRYSKLSEYLHVSDRKSERNRGHPDYDKLAKVRWLYDHLRHIFPQYKNRKREQVHVLITYSNFPHLINLINFKFTKYFFCCTI